ncbi:YczE/YyaS/YitT family protein [Pontibacter beigongshangensis]|uniref:YczE/YyaS/YitT family protein n=1 Tax=Pontibacter beigongshangensis TaxID=2574733 RepID=UPI0016502BCE|nr:YitT family protein [Pontibacter beigongshangensis]
MREKVVQYVFFFSGLILIAFGNALAVKVKFLGLNPWEALNVALFQKFGLTIGAWSTIIGLLLLVVALFVKRTYVNIGTVLNALLLGPMLDVFLWLDYLPDATHTPLDYVILAFAILLAGLGGGLYVSGGVGAGPRDGFMLIIAENTKLSVSRARVAVELVVLAISYFLGGPVFIVTFFYTLLQSPIFQVSLKFFGRLRMSLTEKWQVQEAN